MGMSINFLDPLRHTKGIIGLANQNASIMFFAGMNTNSAHPNYFAYSVAKIATIKAMELLDAELSDCKCFTLGPGYIPTKMHEQIRRAGLQPAAKLKGASLDDLYDCLIWAHGQPKAVIGGRNIAVHTDDWRNPEFAEKLAADSDIYKLRRLI
jgi:NAD(P)-dependent dehydrogenase (short-subunit alcohol dehydrogenase family)